MYVAMPVWRQLCPHCVLFAAVLACAKTGNKIAAKIAMIAMTTSNSMSVNARF
jgi:hypothetical protein